MESFLILLPVFKRMLMLPRRWNTICQMMRTYLSWECQNQILKAVTKVVRIFVPHCETFLSAENSLINVATEAVDHLCIDRRKCLYSLSSLVIIALNFDQIPIKQPSIKSCSWAGLQSSKNSLSFPFNEEYTIQPQQFQDKILLL